MMSKQLIIDKVIFEANNNNKKLQDNAIDKIKNCYLEVVYSIFTTNLTDY